MLRSFSRVCWRVAEDARTLSGVWAATLTPIDDHCRPDAARAIPYYAELLESGCDGLNVLGTTGEAMSFSVQQRIAFMESLARSLPCGRIMAGTGAASLADAVRLSRRALELGFRASLVLPPFFFRDAGLDGIVRFYVNLIGAVPELAGRLLLYNFPRLSGFTFTPDVVRALTDELPGVIAGVKDSSNDRELQRSLVAQFPALRVFPGSEAELPSSIGAGLAGCISGTVALSSGYARPALGGDQTAADAMTTAREAFADLPLIPAMRYAVAKTRSDDAWLRAMPPQSQLSRDQIKTLEHRLAALETFPVE
jgi:4-hydroxy-tetrahydrodipicolinate synthase